MFWSKKNKKPIRQSFKSGINFGLTSAVITTLGLMIGLSAGTGSRVAVLGGILIIAIADSLSDALGIHIVEESKKGAKQKEIWEATLSTLLAKFVFTITFFFPVLIFNLITAIYINIFWGLFLLSLISIQIAKEQKEKSWKMVTEHIAIALLVIGISYYAGVAINAFFTKV